MSIERAENYQENQKKTGGGSRMFMAFVSQQRGEATASYQNPIRPFLRPPSLSGTPAQSLYALSDEVFSMEGY